MPRSPPPPSPRQRARGEAGRARGNRADRHEGGEASAPWQRAARPPAEPQPSVSFRPATLTAVGSNRRSQPVRSPRPFTKGPRFRRGKGWVFRHGSSPFPPLPFRFGQSRGRGLVSAAVIRLVPAIPPGRGPSPRGRCRRPARGAQPGFRGFRRPRRARPPWCCLRRRPARCRPRAGACRAARRPWSRPSNRRRRFA